MRPSADYRFDRAVRCDLAAFRAWRHYRRARGLDVNGSAS